MLIMLLAVAERGLHFQYRYLFGDIILKGKSFIIFIFKIFIY